MIQSENADMEKIHFLFEVNPNTVEAKSNSDEEYSWIKVTLMRFLRKRKS